MTLPGDGGDGSGDAPRGDHAPEARVLPGHATIRCRLDGPLVVELPADIALRVIDHRGRAFPLPTGKAAVALCRCGRSGRRPFCDGSHKECGFSAAETATGPA